jgi:predicted nucleic acid-binding protein
MIFFLDASALAKRYVLEPGSERIRALFRRRAQIAISRLSEVEVVSALVRRSRSGDVEADIVDGLIESLLEDIASCDVVEIRKPVITHARELVVEHGLRAYDGVQLASALRAKGGTALAFLCADGNLAAAAQAERLRVERLG